MVVVPKLASVLPAKERILLIMVLNMCEQSTYIL